MPVGRARAPERIGILALALSLAAACVRTDSAASVDERSFTIVPPSLNRPVAAPRHVLNLRAIWAQGRFSEGRAVTVDDPVYKRRKTYLAVPLTAIINEVIEPGAEHGHVVFETSDGYRPSMPLSSVREGRGYVAYRDTAPTPGMHWEEFDKQGTYVTPAPFYVVWEGPNSAQYPWPYQLIAIEIWDRMPRLTDFIEGSDPTVQEGVRIFETRCAQCHSINMLGGRLGPELNVPANVTEYWDDHALRLFIADPERVRARSRMPASRLEAAELHAVIAYLHYMKQRKVKVVPSQ